MQNGEPWFVGKDVAEALGYTKARNAMSQHVDEVRPVLGRLRFKQPYSTNDHYQ